MPHDETPNFHPATPTQAAPALLTPQLPAALADVALIPAKQCAEVGAMSLSWWHAEVAAGRAPRPVIQGQRCTRWAVADVRAFWQARAAAPACAGAAVTERAKRASSAAQAKRSQAGRVGG
jgi:predicted DNA-binding transcriptional regulator AlpA